MPALWTSASWISLDGQGLARNRRLARERLGGRRQCGHAEQRAPADAESRAYFNELHTKAAPKREDIVTWFDLLDVDDYVSFGGQA